jgi:hypothetical protein
MANPLINYVSAYNGRAWPIVTNALGLTLTFKIVENAWTGDIGGDPLQDITFYGDSGDYLSFTRIIKGEKQFWQGGLSVRIPGESPINDGTARIKLTGIFHKDSDASGPTYFWASEPLEVGAGMGDKDNRINFF